MNDQNIRTCDMFGRVTTFGRDNAADFAADSQAAKEFAQLSGVMLEIDAGHADKKERTTPVKKAKIETLRAEMKNLARTARQIEKKVPGTADKFRMPTMGSLAALLASARKMIAELGTPSTLALFVAYEVSPQIVPELEGMVTGIETATDEGEHGEVESVENTAAINLAIAKGRDLVDSLDAAVRNRYKSNAAKIAAWETASHIERPSRRKKTETTPATEKTSQPAAAN